MDANLEQQPVVVAGSIDHPIRRGSAANVFVAPPVDVSMAMTQADQPGPIAGPAEEKRQKKDEVTLENLDLSHLLDGFIATITSLEEPHALTQLGRGSESMLMKHHKAIVPYQK
jgi:hypothetical protein